MQLSPAVTAALAGGQRYTLTQREMEWLVTQADGLDLKESAKAMNLSYKTPTVWRRNIAKNTDSAGKGTINRRLAKIRRTVTGNQIITDRTGVSGITDDHAEGG